MCLMQRKDWSYFIHNHLSFLVKYNKDEHTGLARIVGFEVKPYRFDIHPADRVLSFFVKFPSDDA